MSYKNYIFQQLFGYEHKKNYKRKNTKKYSSFPCLIQMKTNWICLNAIVYQSNNNIEKKQSKDPWQK